MEESGGAPESDVIGWPRVNRDKVAQVRSDADPHIRRLDRFANIRALARMHE